MRVVLPDRFWAKVDKSRGPNACWIWTAYKSPQGYGKFLVLRDDGKWRMKLSHRLSFEEFLGRPVENCALHRCDTPACVNPSHLYEGSRKDNAADRDSKGRGADRSGSKNGRAKLSLETAVACRYAFWMFGVTQAALAKTTGVSDQTMSLVARGKLWLA